VSGDVERRLAYLRTLEAGWGPDGDGKRISEAAVNAVREFLRDPAIVPGLDGSLQVEFGSTRTNSLDVLFNVDGTLDSDAECSA
jgi:hypothetical protein